jgi:hypothetical protein
MRPLTRIILSWTAVATTAVLSIIAVPSYFGRPDVMLPLLLAYLFRYELRPPIPRTREAHRGWLLLPLVLVAFHVVIFPATLVLWIAIVAFSLWCVWDDVLIYRLHRETRAS